MAIGAGWQSVVVYVNIGCYYLIGIPIGVLLGYAMKLHVEVSLCYAMKLFGVSGFLFKMMLKSSGHDLILKCIWLGCVDWNVDRHFDSDYNANDHN